VIDYANDPIDLRLQSRDYGGIPDYIVHDIIAHLLVRIVIRQDVRICWWNRHAVYFRF